MRIDQFRARLHSHLSSYVTETRRAAMKLDGRLQVLMIDARRAPLTDDEISQIVTEEMNLATERMAEIPRAQSVPVLNMEEPSNV